MLPADLQKILRPAAGSQWPSVNPKVRPTGQRPEGLLGQRERAGTSFKQPPWIAIMPIRPFVRHRLLPLLRQQHQDWWKLVWQLMTRIMNTSKLSTRKAKNTSTLREMLGIIG